MKDGDTRNLASILVQENILDQFLDHGFTCFIIFRPFRSFHPSLYTFNSFIVSSEFNHFDKNNLGILAVKSIFNYFQ